MILSASILADMVQMNSDLFPLALLFREYAIPGSSGIDWHQSCIKYHSRILSGEDTEYYFRNQLHRESGPAIQGGNGKETWYYAGKLHRTNGPAMTYYHKGMKSQRWFHRGENINIHDGPLSVTSNETIHVARYSNYYYHWVKKVGNHFEEEEWCDDDDKYSRLDGPSYICRNPNGYISEWYHNGIRHRTQRGQHAGPAIESYNHGRFNIDKDITSNVELGVYEKVWIDSGRIHRMDGPAIETNGEYGDQWFRNGEPLMVRKPYCPGLE